MPFELIGHGPKINYAALRYSPSSGIRANHIADLFDSAFSRGIYRLNQSGTGFAENWAQDELYTNIPNEINGALYSEQEVGKKKKIKINPMHFETAFQVMDVVASYFEKRSRTPTPQEIETYVNNLGHLLTYCHDAKMKATPQMVAHTRSILACIKATKYSGQYNSMQQTLETWCMEMETLNITDRLAKMMSDAGNAARIAAHDAATGVVNDLSGAATSSFTSLKDTAKSAAASAVKPFQQAASNATNEMSRATRSAKNALQSTILSRPRSNDRATPLSRDTATQSETRRLAKRKKRTPDSPRSFNPVPPPSPHRRHHEQEETMSDKSTKQRLLQEYQKTNGSLNLDREVAELTLREYRSPKKRTKFDMAVITAALVQNYMQDKTIPLVNANHLNRICRSTESSQEIVDSRGKINEARLLELARGYMQMGRGPIIAEIPIIPKESVQPLHIDEEAKRQIDALQTQTAEVNQALAELRRNIDQDPGIKMIENVRNLYTPDQLKSVFGSNENLNELLDNWGTLNLEEQSTVINIVKNDDIEAVRNHASGRVHFTGAFTQVRDELFKPPRNKENTRGQGIATIFSIADHPGRIDRYDKSETMRDEKARFSTTIIPALQTLSGSFPEFTNLIPILQHELNTNKNMYQAFCDAKKRYIHENSPDDWERMTTIAHASVFLRSLAGGSSHAAYQGTTTDPDGTRKINASNVYPTTVFAAVYREHADPNILTKYDLDTQDRLFNLLLNRTAIVGANGSGKSVLQATALGAYIGLPIAVDENDNVATKVNFSAYPDVHTNMLATADAPHSTGQTAARRLISTMVHGSAASDEVGSGFPHAGQLAAAVALGSQTYGSQILHDGMTFAQVMQALVPDIYNQTTFITMQDYRPESGLIESSEGVGVLAACTPSTRYLEALNAKIKAQGGSDIKGIEVYMQIAKFLERQEAKKPQPFQTTGDLETAGMTDKEVDDRQPSALNALMTGALNETLDKGPFLQSASLLLRKRGADLLAFLTDPNTTQAQSSARGELLANCLPDNLQTLNAFRLAGLSDAIVNTEDFAHTSALITDIANNSPSVKNIEDFNRLLSNSAYLSPETKKFLSNFPALLEKAKKIGSTRVRETINYQQVQDILLEELKGNCRRLANSAITPKDFELVTEADRLRTELRKLEIEQPPEPTSTKAIVEKLLLAHIDPDKRERIFELFQEHMIDICGASKWSDTNTYARKLTNIFWSLANDVTVVNAMGETYGPGNLQIMEALTRNVNRYILPAEKQVNLDFLTTDEKAFLLAEINMVFNYHAPSTFSIKPRSWRGDELNNPRKEDKIDKSIDVIYEALETQRQPKSLTGNADAIGQLRRELTAVTQDERFQGQQDKVTQAKTLTARINQSTNNTVSTLLNEIVALTPSLATDPYIQVVISESQLMAKVCNAQSANNFWQQLSNAINQNENSRGKVSDNPTFTELVKASDLIGGNYGDIIQALVVLGTKRILDTGLSDANVEVISSDLNNVAGLLTYAHTLHTGNVWCKAEVKEGAGLQIKNGINLSTAANNAASYAAGNNTQKLLSGLNNFRKINMTINPGCNTLTGPVGMGKSTSLNLISQIMGLAHSNGGIVPAEQCTIDTYTRAKSMAISDTASKVSRFTANSESIADLTLWITAQTETSKPIIILDEPGLGTDAAGRRKIITTMVENIYERCPNATIILVTHEAGIANDLSVSIPNAKMLGINPDTKEIIETGRFNESNPYDPRYVEAAVTKKLQDMGISQANINKNLPVILKYLGDLYRLNVYLDDLQHNTSTASSN